MANLFYSKIRTLFTRWTTPPSPAGENEIRYWQDKLLFTLLLAGLILGFPVYIPSVALCIKEQLWIVAVADTLLYAWVAVLFFKRRMPFAVRAYSIVYMTYALGMVLLLTVGPFGAGAVWLFAFPVLAAVFMGLRTSIMALCINVGSIVLVGILLTLGTFQWNSDIINAMEKWVVIALNFMFLNTIVAISVAYISRGLMISLQQEKSMRGSLEKQHGELVDFTRQLEHEMAERKHQEKARRKLEDQLRQAQKMEAIGTLAGGIAHDFNNILSSVIGYTELALGETEKGSRLADDLQEIYTAGNRAKDLVRQILTFARHSEEKIIPIQISTIVKEALKMLRSAIPATIAIKQEIQSKSLVMANPTQIHQIFMNLCTNAAQAMEDDGGILTVRLYDEKIETDVREKTAGLKPGIYQKIEISDTGKGIAEKDLGSIFDPYFTTKAVGEGTGLGLSVVHGIVKSYGGSVSVKSAPGKGTVFSVYLPISKREVLSREEPLKALPRGTERILFVDDEAPVLQIGSRHLEELGYAVTIQNSSVAALELFKTDPDQFDLVITDMTMPNMTGDQFAIELMKIRADIPVILCTGYSKKVTADSASEIGIKAIAYKPIAKADFANTVRKVLDEAK
jgi:signal transduction histidine kinase/ActR/RegA family two-component response regulator